METILLIALTIFLVFTSVYWVPIIFVIMLAIFISTGMIFVTVSMNIFDLIKKFF